MGCHMKNKNKRKYVYEVCLYVKGYPGQSIHRGRIPTLRKAMTCAYEFMQKELTFMHFENVPPSQFNYVKILKCKVAHDRYIPTTIAIINCN